MPTLPTSSFDSNAKQTVAKPLSTQVLPDADVAVRIEPGDQPKLFELIEYLCRAAGVALPCRVEIDVDPTCHVAQESGRFAVFVGAGRYSLKIGLPLVLAMPLRQLTGVLAHECRHLLQAKRRLNWPLAFSTPGIARLLSCAASRRLEFDADLFAAQIVGRQAVLDAAAITQSVYLAWQMVLAALPTWRDENMLPDDLPALSCSLAQQLRQNPRCYEPLRSESFDFATRWYDESPSEPDRMAALERESTTGKMRVKGNSVDVFQDVVSLCKRCSLTYYRKVIDSSIEPHDLVSTSDLILELSQRSKTKSMLANRNGVD